MINKQTQQEIDLQDEEAEGSERSTTDAMHKMEILLADGRYMIFYTFEDEENGV